MKIDAPVLVRIAAVGCGIAAVGLAAAGFVPYEHMKSLLVPYLPAGKGEMFTVSRYSQAVMGTRGLALALMLLAFGLFFAAVPIAHRFSAFCRDVGSLASFAASKLAGMRGEDRLHLAALAGILLWSIVLRLIYINSPMRWDESDTFLSFASRPLFVGLTYYTPNNHLLQTLLMHLSYIAFGISPLALRIPVLLSGILIVPLTYAWIRAYQGKDPALLAAALACASFPLIEYSTNARGYSIGTVFLLLMILLGALGIRGYSAAWTLVPIAGALSIYSVPTMCFGVAGFFAWILLTTKSMGRVLKLGLATGAITLLLYAPVFAAVGFSRVIHNDYIASLPTRDFIKQIPFAASSIWEYWNLRMPVALTVLIAVGALVSVMNRGRRHSTFSLLLATVLVSIVMIALQRVHPPRRVWLFLVPLYFAAAADGWNLMWSRIPKARWAVPILAILLSGWMGVQVLRGGPLYRPGGERVVFYSAEEYGFPDAEALVIAFRDRLVHGATLVCANPHELPIRYQMVRYGLPYRPSPSGDLLIITKPGATLSSLSEEKTGIPTREIQVLGKIATYPTADVFLGKRICSQAALAVVYENRRNPD